MKAQDLMVGNYVLADVGLPSYQVHQIQSSEIHDLEIGSITIEPIPLTEEWLVKFGFDKVPLGFRKIFNSDGDIVMINIFQGKFIWRYMEREIKHVHQLQNLYKALTNEELK